ncbi:MAG: hypothetical protein RLY59_175 [Actinomycetota bacterium]
MDKALVTGILLVLVVLAILGMVLSWRKKVKRDSRFQIVLPGTSVTDHTSAPVEFSGFYVATTLAVDPLHRLTLPGLGFRADAHLLVSSDGITIAPRGEKNTFIPAAQIVQIYRTQVAIDKAVEKDGLTAISWSAWDTARNESVEFTSFFRFSIPEIRLACEKALVSNFPNATSKEVSS